MNGFPLANPTSPWTKQGNYLLHHSLTTLCMLGTVKETRLLPLLYALPYAEHVLINLDLQTETFSNISLLLQNRLLLAFPICVDKHIYLHIKSYQVHIIMTVSLGFYSWIPMMGSLGFARQAKKRLVLFPPPWSDADVIHICI